MKYRIIFKVGGKHKWRRPGCSNEIIYILTRIDYQVIYRWYSYRRKSWQYCIESIWAFVYGHDRISFLSDAMEECNRSDIITFKDMEKGK